MRSISVALVLFSLAVAFGTPATAQSVTTTSPRQPTQVVFVCEHGSVKSFVAMEHFNRKAEERGLRSRAVAGGTVPEPGVPESVRSGLRADGFEISGFVPQLLTAFDVNDAALVVSFDQDITKVVGIRVRHLRWDNLPGVLADYARGRDAIVSQLEALVDALALGDSP